MGITVYPVVHVTDRQQAVDQSSVAFGCGAAGVFLIDHGRVGVAGLIESLDLVQQAFPHGLIGVNILQAGTSLGALTLLQGAKAAGSLGRYPDALWVDDAIPDREATRELRDREPNLQAIRLFGGTAFKYTSSFTEDPAAAARQAVDMSPFVDVVTTSGPATGESPSPEKIAAMKLAIGDRPLAVASGIDADNVESYRGSVDAILVASSVETSRYSGIFDETKLRRLMSAAQG